MFRPVVAPSDRDLHLLDIASEVVAAVQWSLSDMTLWKRRLQPGEGAEALPRKLGGQDSMQGQ